MTKVVAKARGAYGDIPEGWTSRRLRFDVRLNPKKAVLDMNPDELVSFVPMDAVGERGGLRLDENRELADVYEGYTYFEDGDLCIAKITPCFENGKGALAGGLTNGVGFGTTELHVVRPGPNIDRRFLFYISIADNFRKIGESEMYGAGGQKRIDEGFIKDWVPPLPPLTTQRRIAQFLNEKTARIDGLIEKKRALLERLAEKRQALITRAVTKGLNPDAPMKPSGIDWLGDIPAHWEIKRLKEVCTKIVDCKNRTPPNVDDGEYFVIRTSCLGNGRFDPKGGYWTDEESFDEWTKKGIPRPGDVLISREAPMGEACLFPEGYQLCLGQRMMFARANPQVIDSYFLLSSIYSDVGREYVDLRKKGTTVGHLRVPEVYNFPVMAPPLEEQRHLVAMLRRELNSINYCEQQIESSAERLIEYRSALITAAVTGQIGGLQ